MRTRCLDRESESNRMQLIPHESTWVVYLKIFRSRRFRSIAKTQSSSGVISHAPRSHAQLLADTTLDIVSAKKNLQD